MRPHQLRAFIAMVDSTAGPDDCWLWRGRPVDGYGTFGKYGQRAHRVAYELMVAPIPDGLVIDHLCGNRICVNPAHLEPVTQRENLLRSTLTLPHYNARKTHCPQGHPYSPMNTYSAITVKGYRRRECKACRRDRTTERVA